MTNARVASAIVLAMLCLGTIAPARAQAPQAAADHPAADHPMTIAELFAWKNVRFPAVSEDGHWMAYVIGSFRDDSEFVLRNTLDGKDRRFPAGENGGGPKFSGDSRWLAMTARSTHKQIALLKKQQKGPQSCLRLLNLASSVILDFADIKDFGFSGDHPAWVAIHKEQSDALAKDKSKDKATGSDLLLHELATGVELNVGNVSNYAFDDSGKWLAMTIDAQNHSGNGLVIRNMETGVVSAIDNGDAVYEKLSWAESGDGLTALKGWADKKLENRVRAVIGVTGFSSGNIKVTVYDPGKDGSFPKGMAISGNRAPAWTQDLQGLLFGISPNEPKLAPAGPGGAAPADEAAADDDKPNLMIWNWQDTRTQTLQQKDQPKDLQFSYLATYRVPERKFIRLADEGLRDVHIPKRGRWAVGVDESPYALQGSLSGQTLEAHARAYEDLYVVDLESGARRPLHKKVRSPWYAGESPDGSKALYFEDANYHVCDLATASCREITSRVPTSFVDVLDDHHPELKPPMLQPAPVWTKDSRAVIASDLYDLWMIPTDQRAAVNLTVTGKKEQTSYRLLAIEPKRDAGKGVDLSRPLYATMFGMLNKKGGIARIGPGRPGAETLIWQDAIFSDFAKARDAETFIFKRETHTESPEYYVAGSNLAAAKKVSDVGVQQHGIAWSSGSKLIQYTSAKGDKLQAALFLPSNYQEGHSYPTIVSMYERKSQLLNSYFSPVFMGIFDEIFFTSHGYAILEPDITYRTNDPGMSAAWCVLPALQAAIATGIVDAKHVGVQGHSWGGYQTAFLVTQTNAFAAADAGAPLSDMLSMWGLIYKNTGNANSVLLESGQGRFAGPPLENLDAYIRNSPVFHAAAVKTPLLIMHDDMDGAVDFTQGLEFYNTLRRLGKPVVMLEYPGENHTLAKVPNQKDYTLRMLAFFDHFLKGAPAPAWWSKGVSRIELQNQIRTGTVEKDATSGDTEPAPVSSPGK